MLNIFISYASEDEKLAKEFSGFLSQYGYTTYFASHDLKQGNIGVQLKEGIRNCDILLEVLTRNSLKKVWVKQEIAMADVLNKPYLAVAFEQVNFKEIEGVEEGKFVLPLYSDPGSGRKKLEGILREIKNKKMWGIVVGIGALALLWFTLTKSK